jgi:hypothetical protein
VAVASRFLRLSVARIFPSESRKTRLLVSSLGEYLLGWAHGVGDASVANFMIQEGQCPSEVQMLRETLYGPPRFFLSFLPRLGLQRDHRRCTSYLCRAADVTKGTYETHHTSPSCHCAMIFLEGEILASRLKNGKIPRLWIGDPGQVDGQDDITIGINRDEPYIAISHVWSDGLGNERANGLPACQVRRLYKYATDLARKLGLNYVPNIWIDSLCMPVDPKLRQYRRLAIEWLPRTFDEAEHILVLDEELYIESIHSSMMELRLRILCSTWMRHL